MGGIMWALRWLAAISIFTTCIAMTVEAELASWDNVPAPHKPLVAAQDRVRSSQLCTTAAADSLSSS
jgi:hypothetical protein